MPNQHQQIESIALSLLDYLASIAPAIKQTEQEVYNFCLVETSPELIKFSQGSRFALVHKLSQQELSETNFEISQFLQTLSLAYLLVSKVDQRGNSKVFMADSQKTFAMVLLYLLEELLTSVNADSKTLNNYLSNRPWLLTNLRYICQATCQRVPFEITKAELQSGEWINNVNVQNLLYGKVSKLNPLPYISYSKAA